MNQLLKTLGDSLSNIDSDENRKNWANYIVSNKIELIKLLDLLELDLRTATRFIWLVGDISESDPKLVFPAIPHLFAIRKHIGIKNYNRSLAKIFWLCGIPNEIQGEAVTEMFNWILDPKCIVSTKNYSILALYNISLDYEELKEELKLVIDDQIDKNSISFKKCANKVLGMIK